MNTQINSLGQPLGPLLVDWKPPAAPVRAPMQGHYCRLEPLDPAAHGQALYTAYADDAEGRLWTYLPNGPFNSYEEFARHLHAAAQSSDPLFFAIVDKQSKLAVGMNSFMRIDCKNGVIETGYLTFSPRLQRTPASTEANYLMMQHAFELGYRRYEWKCNALNEPSRRAALRLGFTFEGIFRQAAVIKGRSRDTAWYSILDSEWPKIEEAFRRWLAPANFDAQGRQRKSLAQLRTSG